jgi:hypothetical protein
MRRKNGHNFALQVRAPEWETMRSQSVIAPLEINGKRRFPAHLFHVFPVLKRNRLTFCVSPSQQGRRTIYSSLE